VSPQTQDRGLRVLDALLKALVEHGCKVVPWQAYGVGSHAVVEGEKIFFRLRERTKRKAHRPASEEEDTLLMPKFDYSPTGLLLLSVWWEQPDRVESDWEESARLSLDQRLADAVSWILDAPQAIKERRVQLEERRKLEAAAARRAWELEKAKEPGAVRPAGSCSTVERW
jgi:hypothetical protein